MQPFKYIFLGHTAMQLKGNKYYRIAGEWDIDFKFSNGKFYSVSTYKHLNNVELTQTTKELHDKDNEGYL